MKNIYKIFVFLWLVNNIFSQSYMWVKKLGGTGNVYVYKIIEDNERNFYVYGYFNGQLIIENTTLNAAGTTQDVFLAKLNKNGNLLWIKQITGPGTESTYEILLSPDNNYVYITGTFNGNITIDNLGIYNTGGNDIFLIQLSKNGAVIWGKNIVYGNNHQLGGFFSIDDVGNFYVTGTFFDLCTFYPGTITLNYNPSYPNRQNFVAKFDSNGEIIWAKKLESDNINTLVKNITYFNNSLIISGQGVGKIYYDGTFISQLNNTYRTGFFIKLNSNGGFSLIRRFFSNNNDIYVTKHVLDDNGFIYLAFKYRGNYFYLDSTATQQTILRYYNVNASYYDIGLAKYDFNGLLKGAKTYGSSQDEDVKGIDYSNKRVIIAGSYKAQINFEGNILNNNGQEDAYAVILNENLNVLYALGAGGDKIDWGNSAYFSSTSRYYLWAGDFASATINFGSITLTNDNPPSLKDGFIAKYGCFDTLFATVNNITCPGGSDGSITVTPTEGNEPYSYLWSNGATTNTISNLTANLYTVTVSGTAGCKIVRTFKLTENTPLISVNINILSFDKFCTNNTYEGQAQAIPNGGKLPYTYNWSNGQTTQIASNLRGGITYRVTVRDACNITKTASVVMQNSDVPSVTIEKTDIVCYGDPTGTATAIPAGIGKFRYRWSNGQTIQSIKNLPAGTYSVTITDRGCNNATASATTTITQPQPLTLTAIAYPSSPCKNTGVAIALPKNGTPPYSFKWSNNENNDTITKLASGSYTVTVKDFCNKSLQYTVYVGKKSIILTPEVLNCTMSGQCTGKLKINVTGGDPPYTYLWSNGKTTQIISSVCEGNYSVTVTDFNGCTATKTNILMPVCSAKQYVLPPENNFIINENNKTDELIKINIFPNPVKYYLKIKIENIDELNIQDGRLFIYSIDGKMINDEQFIINDYVNLDVSDLKDGLYILKIIVKNNIYSFKFSVYNN